MVEGDFLYPRLLVRNRWPIPVWGLALEGGLDAFVSEASAENHVSVALSHVPAWSRAEFPWEFYPRRRGSYPQGDVMLTSALPFGLWTAKRRAPMTLELGGQCHKITSSHECRKAMDKLALIDLADVESEVDDNFSRWPEESQTRISIGVNDQGHSGSARFEIKVTSNQKHATTCRRIDLESISLASMK